MQLAGKLIIEGKIEALTGLSIGGSKTDVEIGGIDNNVIKDAEGVPYIPGSSIKGKMRSLLEKRYKKEDICSCAKRTCPICNIFGTSASSKIDIESLPTRLYVRDAKLNEEIRRQMEKKEGPFSELELTYTEGKWENTIHRLTSRANPRQTERVPAGSIFDLHMIFNLLDPMDVDFFKQMIAAMRLLEDDYLGGNGSRGYGRIRFSELTIVLKTVKDYEEGNEGKEIFSGSLDEFDQDEALPALKQAFAEVENQ